MLGEDVMLEDHLGAIGSTTQLTNEVPGTVLVGLHVARQYRSFHTLEGAEGTLEGLDAQVPLHVNVQIGSTLGLEVALIASVGFLLHVYRHVNFQVCLDRELLATDVTGVFGGMSTIFQMFTK